jgi:hypothetical protein
MKTAVVFGQGPSGETIVLPMTRESTDRQREHCEPGHR